MAVRLVVVNVVNVWKTVVVCAITELAGEVISFSNALFEFFREFVVVFGADAFRKAPMNTFAHVRTELASGPKFLLWPLVGSSTLEANIRGELLFPSQIVASLRTVFSINSLTALELKLLSTNGAGLRDLVASVIGRKAGAVAIPSGALGNVVLLSADWFSTVQARLKNVIAFWHNEIPSTRDSIHDVFKVGHPPWRAGLSTNDQFVLAQI